MNKKQQELHDIMLSILPFEEFRQNDVVEESVLGYECNLLCFNKSTGKYLIKYDQLNNTILKEEFAEDLKFINRKWTREDFENALLIKDFIIEQQRVLENIAINIQDNTYMSKCRIIWNPRKSVLEQESIESIIKVLK